MQGVVLLLLPCQHYLVLASIAEFADDSHTAISYKLGLGWSIETDLLLCYLAMAWR